MSEPYLSIVIPAYNEADWLPETLSALRNGIQSSRRNVELIVVDNNSTDDTARVARDHGATVVFEEHNQIARARNAGADRAQGDWLLFVDADTLIPEALLHTILDRTTRGNHIGGGALLKFREQVPWYAEFGLEVWNALSASMNWAAGSVIWVRREAYAAIGGFDESVYASEEIWFSLDLHREARQTNQQVAIINHHRARTSARKFQQFSAWQLGLGFASFFVNPWIIYSQEDCEWYWYEK